MVGKTLIDKDLKDLLSKEYLSNRKTTVGFPDFTDKQYLTDDNRKYMKMYRWLSPFYDITEKMVERFWSHHRIAEMRRQLMDKLEYDIYGFLKKIGGIAKGHPNEKDCSFIFPKG